jgi:hypothetical protein
MVFGRSPLGRCATDAILKGDLFVKGRPGYAPAGRVFLINLCAGRCVGFEARVDYQSSL